VGCGRKNVARIDGSSPGQTDATDDANFPDNKMGYATYGAIVSAGRKVVASPTVSNPNHATLSGITPAVAESLFTLIANPNPCPKWLSDH